MRNTAILILAIVIVALPAVLPAAGVATSVVLYANPDSIIADGKSVTTITAEIRDQSGRFVPDGTLVSFSSDIGTIPSTVSTVAGVARVRLTSGTTVGTATVSAWVTSGGAIGKLRVEMLEPGTEMSRESFVSISSPDYLVYDSEKMLLYASGKVKVNHRGITFLADEVGLDINKGILKCRMASGGEPVRVSKGNKTMVASVLAYNISESRGEAFVDGESGKIQKVAFRGSDLVTEPSEEYRPANYFDLPDLSASPMVVSASSVVLRPGKDLRVRRAKFYVDGKKMLSMPLYVAPIGAMQVQTSRYIGWGATGLRVDLPFFYSLSANSTGSVRLRRGQQAGWGYYSADQGWALDVVEDYTSDSGAEGALTLNRITTGEWGAQWHHNQILANGGQVYSYIDFPSHKDLFASTSVSMPVGSLNVGANLYGSKFQGQNAGLTTDLYVQTEAKPIANGAANVILRAKTAFDSGASTGIENGGTGLQMQLLGKRLTFAKDTNLSTSLTLGQTWGSRHDGFTVLGTAALMRNLGKAGSAGLSYSFTSNNSNLGIFGQHKLSASLLYTPTSRWQANIYGTYTLDKPMTSSFADISYKLTPNWRLSALQTFQKYDQFDYSDTEIAIGRTIAGHEAALVWSKEKSKLRVEFSAARF